MSSNRTPDEVLADLAAARAARTALIAGERVEDVWRDGRRMRLASVTLEELNEMIDQLRVEYEEAMAEEQGRPRRGAIGLSWRN